jgi:hypothetical protein
MKKLLLLLLLIPSLTWGALVPAIEVRSDGASPETTVEVGEEVYFSASGTTYEDAVLLGQARYEWDWGDGYAYENMSGCVGQPYYSIMGGGLSAVHYFMTPGTYTVTLSVKVWDVYTAIRSIPQITSTSSSSVTIGKGEKTFTVETGKSFTTGMSGKVYVTASTAKYVMGTITSYNSETGVLVMNSTCASSTGTYNAWTASFDTDPIASETTTVEITVTGEAPLSGFEIQRANYNNRSKQYLYIQIPAAHRGTTTQLKVSLIGATTGTTVLLAPKENLAAEEILLFDQSSLAADHYVVQAELLDADDEQITGGIWRDKFYKNYAGLPSVYMDENNAFWVDGEINFPITSFLLDAPLMKTYRDDGGINTLHSQGYNPSGIYNSTTFGTYLDQGNALSLKVIGPGRGNYTIDFSPYLGNSWKRNHDPDIIKTYVQNNKNNPALFGWNWQDEVNLGGANDKIYPPTVAAWSYISKNEDPQHPIFNTMVGSDWSIYYGVGLTTFDYLSSAWFFGGKKWAQDVLTWDTYPISQQLYPIQNINQTTFPDMGTYAVYLDAVDRSIANNKNLIPYIPALQPCGGKTPIIISSDQVYLETWLNVIHGAKGITWFNYFSMSTYGRWDSMKRFADQIEDLKAVVLSTPPSRTVTDTANPTNAHSASYDLNRVDTMIREDANYIYVFAARVTEPDPANSYVSVTLTGTPGTVINNGQISDTGDVHVWNLPETVTIGTNGTISAIATCVDEGYITATPATLTKIVTAVSGWASVTNTQNATGGSRYQGIEPATLEDVTFTVSGLDDTTLSVEVVDESRTLTATDGVFADDFDKNAVHIYKIAKNTPTTYTITVTPAGLGGGEVTSSPSGISCGEDCTETVVQGNTVVLTATPNATSAFDGWSGTYGCTGTSTCTVSSIAANAAVTATFSVKETPPVYHNMFVSYIGNGSGVTSPVAGEHSEGEGTEVAITATASANNAFTAWGGTCGCTGSSSPCTIASFPENDCTVTAEFTKNTLYIVDVTLNLGVASVLSDTGVGCEYGSPTPCQVVAEPDSTVVFVATPDEGYGDCTFSGCTGATGSCTMDENKSLSVSCTFQTGGETSGSGSISIGNGGTITLGRSEPLTGVNMGTENKDGVLLSMAKGRADCWVVQAPATGSLTTAYVAHGNTSEATARVCVYSNDGDAPDAGDAKLGCSGAVTSSSVEWATSNMDGGSVVSGQNYFMCMFVDNDSANTFSVDKSSTNTNMYYKTGTLFYDTPGATLFNTTVSWNVYTDPQRSVYVTITP